MKLLNELDVSGKTVFVRADLDVSTGSEDHFETGTRLANLKTTVSYLLGKQAKVVIAGHIDRPTPRIRDGKPVIEPKLSTKQLIEPLERILGVGIEFKSDLDYSSSDSREDIAGSSPQGRTIILLENLRFWPGETENSEDFASQLANLADVYVNEAFGNSHRNHASMVALPKLLINHSAGFHLEQEVEELSNLLSRPQRPFVAIVGGAKMETKLPLLEHLAKIADFVLVGGELPMEIAKQQIKFPPKVVVAQLTEDTKDISDKSMDKFEVLISRAKSVVWNGPLGLYEEGNTAGSLGVAKAVIESSAYTVVGGGETAEFLAQNNLLSKFSFVSAGGGAMLEFLSGKKLPAISALE